MNIQEKQATWNKERPLFEADFVYSHLLPFFNFNENTGDYEIKSEFAEDEDRNVAFETLNTGWAMWLRAKRGTKGEIDKLNNEHKEQLEYLKRERVFLQKKYSECSSEIDEMKAKLEKLESGDYVLIKKSEIGDYYYDESEGMYIDEPDNFLTHLEAGEVQEVECRGYFDLPSKYAARVWDEANQDVDTWKFFASKEDADKAAAYCESRFAAQGEGHE